MPLRKITGLGIDALEESLVHAGVVGEFGMEGAGPDVCLAEEDRAGSASAMGRARGVGGPLA